MSRDTWAEDHPEAHGLDRIATALERMTGLIFIELSQRAHFEHGYDWADCPEPLCAEMRHWWEAEELE